MTKLTTEDMEDDVIYIVDPSDLDDEFRKDAQNHYGLNGYRLTKKHIDALLSGKNLVWTDGEYTTTIRFDPDA